MSDVDVITITLGFVPSRIWKESIAAYHATRNPELRYKHYFVDQHYPLKKEKNRKELRKICEKYDVTVLDPGKNLGLHEGFNWALKQINPPDNAVIIAYDPDVNPISPGWDMALVRAIRGDQKQNVVWASLIHETAVKEIATHGYEHRKADGYIDLYVTRRAVMNSICAWHMGWLRKVGGLHEPTAFYGHLEAEMWSRLGGRDWAFLPGWTEDETLRAKQDKEYQTYKWVHAHTQTWKGDFESWLAAGSPNPE